MSSVDQPCDKPARLLIAQRLLDEYDLVAWIDADVFVWAPENLPIPKDAGRHSAANGGWSDGRTGQLRFRENESNYLCSIARGGEFLDRHIADVVSAIRDSPMQARIGVSCKR